MRAMARFLSTSTCAPGGAIAFAASHTPRSSCANGDGADEAGDRSDELFRSGQLGGRPSAEGVRSGLHGGPVGGGYNDDPFGESFGARGPGGMFGCAFGNGDLEHEEDLLTRQRVEPANTTPGQRPEPGFGQRANVEPQAYAGRSAFRGHSFTPAPSLTGMGWGHPGNAPETPVGGSVAPGFLQHGEHVHPHRHTPWAYCPPPHQQRPGFLPAAQGLMPFPGSDAQREGWHGFHGQQGAHDTVRGGQFNRLAEAGHPAVYGSGHGREFGDGHTAGARNLGLAGFSGYLPAPLSQSLSRSGTPGELVQGVPMQLGPASNSALGALQGRGPGHEAVAQRVSQHPAAALRGKKPTKRAARAGDTASSPRKKHDESGSEGDDGELGDDDAGHAGRESDSAYLDPENKELVVLYRDFFRRNGNKNGTWASHETNPTPSNQGMRQQLQSSQFKARIFNTADTSVIKREGLRANDFKKAGEVQELLARWVCAWPILLYEWNILFTRLSSSALPHGMPASCVAAAAAPHCRHHIAGASLTHVNLGAPLVPVIDACTLPRCTQTPRKRAERRRLNRFLSGSNFSWASTPGARGSLFPMVEFWIWNSLLAAICNCSTAYTRSAAIQTTVRKT